MPTEEAQTLMARTFIKVHYHTAIHITVRLGDGVSPDHLARFIVDVIPLLDLTAISARYGPRGAPAYAPEILLGLLFSGDATGVSCTSSLRLFRRPANRVEYPSFTTCGKGFCHGLRSLFLPTRSHRPGVAVPHAPVGVAQRLRRRVPDDTGASIPRTK